MASALSPDYVRIGQHVWFLTWGRLVALAVAATVAVLVLSAADDALAAPGQGLLALDTDGAATTSSSNLRRIASGDSTRIASSKSVSGSSKSSTSTRKGRIIKTGVMPSFCAARGSTYFLEKWKLAYLGSSEFPMSPSDDAQYCDWMGADTKTAVPFRMCTYDKAVDTQISAYLHKEGAWNPSKRDIVQDALPILNKAGADPSARTLVLDIGANVGFYTMLAATRGYDVLAIEASQDSITRLLFSLDKARIHTARSGADVGSGSGATRRPVVYVYRNAAADSYNSMSLHHVTDNPGADWVTPTTGDGLAVTSVFVDDLLIPSAREGGGSARKELGDAVPEIDPAAVQLVKISAEAMDSRVINGMRRLLSLGKVPFLLFVYNDAHVRLQGCEPGDLIQTLVDYGYSMYHAGVYYKRQQDVQKFIAGMTGRSMELVFVAQGVDFW